MRDRRIVYLLQIRGSANTAIYLTNQKVECTPRAGSSNLRDRCQFVRTCTDRLDILIQISKRVLTFPCRVVTTTPDTIHRLPCCTPRSTPLVEVYLVYHTKLAQMSFEAENLDITADINRNSIRSYVGRAAVFLCYA